MDPLLRLEMALGHAHGDTLITVRAGDLQKAIDALRDIDDLENDLENERDERLGVEARLSEAEEAFSALQDEFDKLETESADLKDQLAETEDALAETMLADA